MAKAAGSGCLQVHVNVEENVTKPVILFFILYHSCKLIKILMDDRLEEYFISYVKV